MVLERKRTELAILHFVALLVEGPTNYWCNSKLFRSMEHVAECNLCIPCATAQATCHRHCVVVNLIATGAVAWALVVACATSAAAVVVFTQCGVVRIAQDVDHPGVIVLTAQNCAVANQGTYVWRIWSCRCGNQKSD